ncbi:MAG: hypothetical protein J5673_01330 [Candidatus Methanomethylophilaceae archaeon]|nr:hypothetical protein [Candidatus Methanomethylophilaceae archaeon]
MKERMRELNIKMTELSEYIKVSRPTLYKYIESYEEGDYESIPNRVVSLFKIMERPEVAKEQVISYIISSFKEEDGNDAGDAVRRYLSDPSSSSSKVEFLQKVATTDCLDSIIPYLNDCIDILSGENIDDEQAYQVARLVLMRSKVVRNLPLKDEELKEVKEILRGSYGN